MKLGGCPAARSISANGARSAAISEGWDRKLRKSNLQPNRLRLAANAAGWRMSTTTSISNVFASHSAENRAMVLHKRPVMPTPGAPECSSRAPIQCKPSPNLTDETASRQLNSQRSILAGSS